jgi:hypothetical protein
MFPICLQAGLQKYGHPLAMEELTEIGGDHEVICMKQTVR